VKGQEQRPKWEQAVFQKALAEGVAENGLRFQCRIAQDANEAFKSIEIGGETWVVNERLKAQCGRNQKGLPYLTVGIVNAQDPERRYRLTWEGDGIPAKMVEVAVKHDSGKKVAATRIDLKLQDAVIAPVRTP